jgi:hypothetical protein
MKRRIYAPDVPQVQGTFFQYIELLSSLLSPDAYASLLPSVYNLCCDYAIDLPATMEIYRPKLHAAIFVRNFFDNLYSVD